MNPKDQIHYDIAELLEKIAHLNIKLAGATKIHPVELDLLRSYLRELDKLADSMPLMQLPKPTFGFPPQEAQPSTLPSFNTPEEAVVDIPTPRAAPIEPVEPAQQERVYEAPQPDKEPEAEEAEIPTAEVESPAPEAQPWQWEAEEDNAIEEDTAAVDEEPELEVAEQESITLEEEQEEPAAEPEKEEEHDTLIEELAYSESSFTIAEDTTTPDEEESELENLDEVIDEKEEIDEQEEIEVAEEPVAEEPLPEKPRFQWELPDKPVAPEPVIEDSNEAAEAEPKAESQPAQETDYPAWAVTPAEEPVAETNEPEETPLWEETPTATDSPEEEAIESPASTPEPSQPAAATEEPVKRSLNDLFNRGESQDLGSRFQFQNRKNLREMIDLSERYVFTKELFGGDADYYDRAIRQLNQFETLAEAHTYLQNDLRPKYNWAGKEQVEQQFTRIVERRFL